MVCKKALDLLTEQQSTFDNIELYKAVALASIVDGNAAIIEQRVADVWESPEIVNLGIDNKGDKIFTTNEVLRIEQGIQKYSLNRKQERGHSVFPNIVNSVIASRTLSDEQKNMLRHCCGTDGVVAIQGSAGSGKSYALAAVNEVYQRSGYKVMGCALSAVAAQNLQDSSDIQSGTIHRLLVDIDIEHKTLDENTVVVIDEAGTADSRLIHKLIEVANGAKLIFVGDTHQLDAIGLSFFRNLQQNIGFAELSENRRQKHEADQQAVAEFRGGHISKALLSYHERGLLSISDDPVDAQDKLINDWDNDRKRFGDNGIILASTNVECRELNQLARIKLNDAGLLGQEKEYDSEYGDINLAEHDRIMFTKNDVRLGVKNGVQATVMTVKDGTFTARLDDGEVITVRTNEYAYFKHSYAISTHKAQGQSVSRAYILSSSRMKNSKELGYVQLTRAKELTRLYADKETLGELAIEELTKQMARSQQKRTALDMLQ